MADKILTELAWRAFAKGREIKDAPLAKALAELAKAESGGPQAELNALDTVDQQIDQLRGGKKADGELQSRLDKMAKAADAQRKLAEKALKEAKSDADEDEASPALLTTKLIPLIREIRKGETRMPALVALAGRDAAVLLSRRAISPARGVLLKNYLGATGGLKFVRGECLFEAGALTFVVQSQAAGLAKKLKAALLQQTEMRLKVRVRGEDPDDIDEEEEGDAADGGGIPQPPATPAGGQTASQPIPQAPSPPGLQRDVDAGLTELSPLVKQVLQKKSPDYAFIATLFASTREKAAAGELDDAMSQLNDLKQRVADSLSQVGSQDASDEGLSEADAQARAEAFKARLTALLPAVKDAGAQDPARAQALKLQISEAGALVRGRRFDAADALLELVEKALQPAKGVEPGLAFNARLAALLPRVKVLSTGRPDEAALLKVRVGAAGAKAKEKDYAAANQALDDVERMLADFDEELDAPGSDTAMQEGAAEGPTASEQRAAQAKAEIEAATGKGSVRFKALLMDWRQSVQRAESELKRFADALVNHPMVVYDPRAEQIRARASELAKQLPRFDGSLEQALTAAADARGAEELVPTREAAARAVEAYQKTLDANPLVRALEDTFVGSASIYTEMQRSLDKLKSALIEA
jgi:hypothetical protein